MYRRYIYDVVKGNCNCKVIVKGNCKEGKSECWAEHSVGWNVYTKSGMNISKLILTLLKYK